MLLGLAITQAGGEPLDQLLSKYVLKPMHLANTASTYTSEIPQPVLHTYDTERNDTFEESTYWSTSWFTAPGAVMTTNICDLTTSAIEVGTGCLLNDEQKQYMFEFHTWPKPDNCSNCVVFSKNSTKYFTFGVIISNEWVFQLPAYAGTGVVHAYLPKCDLSVAIVTTSGQFTDMSVVHAEIIWKAIAEKLTPDNVPFL